MEWKWNEKRMEMEWKNINKRDRCKMEWKWNGNGMEMEWKKITTPTWK